MKKYIFIFIIFGFSVVSYSQNEHIAKFFKCGFPTLDDYNCYLYDTLETGKPISLKLAPNYNTQKISAHYERRMKIMRTAAYLVIKDDEIVYENYWLRFDENSLLNSFSVAKSIVAILLGIAIDEGKIGSIDQKVVDYLPWFNSHLDSSLTIIDLLSMSSGLSWSEEFANPNSDVVKAYYGNKLDKLIKNTHVKNKPGKKWSYQCGNTVLLSMIIESATGMPISKYAEKKLWIPLGAEHEAYWGKSDTNGLTKAFCCFYATPKDFAKLGLLVLHKGNYMGKQIVSEEYIDKVTSPCKWLYYGKKHVDFYGLHFWLVKHHGEYLPYFSGMFGQYIIIYPKENAVVVRFGEMVNELRIEPVPFDLKLYLRVADKLIK